jgi:ribonuclease BN (tRNA processing enzyme)
VAFDLTVLGSAGSHTGPGRACSGYLLRAHDTQVMVDCGNGSTANLQRYTSFDALDAVVVTHRHVDHCIDLIGMFYALKFHEGGQRSVDLYAAPGVLDLLTGLLSRDSQFRFREVFNCVEVDAGTTFEVGPMRLELFASQHPVPTVSVRVAVDGAVVAYSADSAGGPDLVACARDADLFLCEATWQGDAADWPDGIHLTAAGAGSVATEAGVDRLVLTHLLGSLDRDRTLREARRTFSGALSLADDNLTWTLA